MVKRLATLLIGLTSSLALVGVSCAPARSFASQTFFTPKAPPAPDGCRDTLRQEGLRFSPWDLRPQSLTPSVLCEAPQGVQVTRGGAGLRYQPAARTNCAFALRLVTMERIIQEEAKAELHTRVKRVVHLGTYNCRRIAAFPELASEHSFANAIDLATFELANGRQVVVERDWVPASRDAVRPASRFLRKVARRLYDEGVFSVVLTPSYDAHHRNHFHLDGAPYQVDGT